MTKQELANRIASKTGISRESVSVVLEEAAENIMQALEKGDAVFMRGFGVFKNKQQAAKLGRNICKGTSIPIPARRKPFFKPYKEFKKRVNK